VTCAIEIEWISTQLMTMEMEEMEEVRLDGLKEKPPV